METKKQDLKPNFWDRAGIFLSGLCIVHCLALPLGLVLVPVFAEEFLHSNDLTHAILLAFILAVSGFAFIGGYRSHKKKEPVLWFIPGIITIIFATYFTHDTLGHMWEPVFAIIGGLFLIKAHRVNHSCKKCDEVHKHHHNV